ncbi:S8 family serine peptidase [Aquimonas sp.]|jgi:hypothetical protein|uniref:S8 family serine peptidase n=1 Tax=Aquimonas sp. TaxID=1872588 RepID=UPI0037BF68C2
MVSTRSRFPQHRLALALSLALLAPQVGAQSALRDVPAREPSIETLAEATAPGLLLTRAGVFDPDWQQLDGSALGLPDADGDAYALLQFHADAPAPLEWLKARGIDALDYLPHHAWRVRLNGRSLSGLGNDPALRYAGRVPSLLRIDPSLWPQTRAQTLASDTVDGVIELQLARGESAPDVLAAINKLAPSLKSIDYLDRGDLPWVRLDASAAMPGAIEALLRIEAIQWIAPYARPEPHNQNALGPMQGNDLTTAGTPIFARGLTGTGQIIAVADSGLDRNEDWFVDIDFGDGQGVRRSITPSDNPLPPLTGATHPLAKVFAYWVQPGATAFDNNLQCTPSSGPTGFHGSHVSGTVGGDRAGAGGIATPLLPGRDAGDGMAPNAQILFQDIGNDVSGCLSIRNLTGTLAQAASGGARVHNNSWGSDSRGAYGGSDIAADLAARQLRELLVVVAAGNRGGSGPNTTGSPGNNKNGLTVGALGNGNSLSIASFSSRGPTDDGRIKPDIVAPGSSTVSAAGDTSNAETVDTGTTSSKSGTSMAAPTITGATALAHQYFADGFYPRGSRTPQDQHSASAQVMKALLLNSTRAIDLAGVWPNNTFGWGRLWLEHSLYFSGDIGAGLDTRRLRVFERTDDSGLATGAVHEYALANVAAGQELRFTLTWLDPAASAGAAVTLVNDLDLEVVGPDATLYLGNVFTSGVSTSGGTADRRNTVEQVRFTAPSAGAYSVRVRGFNVPGNALDGSSRQGYGLVASGAIGLPEQPALAAPAAPSVSRNDLDGVAVSFSPVSGAQGYQLYRASGTCASADPRAFRMVGHGASAPLLDTSTVGGYGYAWKVRAIGGDVEGEVSTCIDAVSAAACLLPPEFSMSDATANGNRDTCGVELSWTAADSRCPLATGITYRIERSLRPDFQTVSVLAADHSGTSFLDSTVLPDQAYFYRASAADAAGNRSSDPRVLAATPSPASGPAAGSFFDNVDQRSYAKLQAPWQFSTVASDGSFSYHNGPDGSNYAANACASLTLPPLQLGPNAQLTYKARYAIERNWDGVVSQISTDGGQTWASLPPTGGFPGSFAATGDPPGNACGFPASQGAFSGSSSGQFQSFTSNLAAFAGQTVQIRWVFSSDSADEEAGFYLDEIRLNTVIPPEIFANGFETSARGQAAAGNGGQCELP